MRKLFFVLTSLLLVFGSVRFVYAESGTGSRNTTGRAGELCGKVRNVVSERGVKIDAGRKTREAFYRERIQKWKDIATKASELGIDTTVFGSYVIEAESRLDKAVAAYDLLKAKLDALLAVDCANKDAVKSAMNEVRTQRKVAFQARADLNKYIKNTVRPALKILLTQIKAKV